MSNPWKNLSFALGAMILGSIVTGLVLTVPRGSNLIAQDRAGARTPSLNQQDLTAAQGLSNAFRNVAEAIKPTVVSISTLTAAQPRGGRRLPPGIPPQLEDLFGTPRGRSGGQPQQSGMGSGVIVRPDGYILTNNHVIEGADQLLVELYDGQKVTGTLVGSDPKTDLAVVKIDMSGLSSVAIGSSDDIEVGAWVLAIGSPFGLDQTVTAGIISGKNRVQRIIADGEGFEDFLQTDAAINPGNSGGPLVNLRGELIGINTAILSKSGGSAGIGFAIPVSLAVPVLESIIETGEVHRGFLGAQVVDVTPDSVKDLDLKVTVGALIGAVLENQPAAKAGLQPGDVVTKVDGRACVGGTQLRNYVASRRPGTSVDLEVNRRGTTRKVKVNLQERTDEAMALFNAGAGLFGAELIPVTPSSAQKYGYDGLRSGLIVGSVEDGSLAAQAELQVGDVIESAGGVKLKTTQQLADIFADAKKAGQRLQVIVRRGNTRMLLVIR